MKGADFAGILTALVIVAGITVVATSPSAASSINALAGGFSSMLRASQGKQ